MGVLKFIKRVCYFSSRHLTRTENFLLFIFCFIKIVVAKFIRNLKMSISREFKLKKEVFERMLWRDGENVKLVTKRDRCDGKTAYSTLLSPIIAGIVGEESVAATQSAKDVGKNIHMYFFAKKKEANLIVEASIADLKTKGEVVFRVTIERKC